MHEFLTHPDAPDSVHLGQVARATGQAVGGNSSKIRNGVSPGILASPLSREGEAEVEDRATGRVGLGCERSTMTLNN